MRCSPRCIPVFGGVGQFLLSVLTSPRLRPTSCNPMVAISVRRVSLRLHRVPETLAENSEQQGKKQHESSREYMVFTTQGIASWLYIIHTGDATAVRHLQPLNTTHRAPSLS